MLHRAFSRHTRLYTEMVTAPAVLRGERRKLLAFCPSEHPVALQLGGADPEALATAARVGEDFGYDEINLNVGCPSDRVQSGRFGACLMREPDLVADCMSAMIGCVAIPVTLKCRLGVDDQDPEQSLFTLVDACAAAGVRHVVVHARKAWLKGLSPKENRDVPPLDYDLVYRLKRERPGLQVVLNGGVGDLTAALGHMEHVDGVMLGRAAYRDPAILGAADRRVFGRPDDTSPAEALEAYRPYMSAELRAGTPLNAMTRHMLGLFAGYPGARRWRRLLSEGSVHPGAGMEVLDAALAAVVPQLQPAV